MTRYQYEIKTVWLGILNADRNEALDGWEILGVIRKYGCTSQTRTGYQNDEFVDVLCRREIQP